MKGIMKLTLVVALGFFASGCWIIDWIFPSGFTVKTTYSTPPSPTQSGVISPDPNVRVIGHFTDFASSCGNIIGFDITTDNEGRFKNTDFVANGFWNFQRLGGHAGCGLINSAGYISCGGTAKLNCSSALSFVMAPESFNVSAPPATATFTGSGLTTTYGMPIIEFYDEYGTFFDEATASYVSGDGTWLQGSVPSLVGLYSGIYTVVIRNATSNGGRDEIGTATVWVFGNDPPPPEPDPNPCPSPPPGELPPMECGPVY